MEGTPSIRLPPAASCVGERILWVLLNKLNLENSSTNWLQTGETSETALKASQEACEVYTYAHSPHPRILGLGYIDPTVRVDDNGSGVEMHTRYRLEEKDLHKTIWSTVLVLQVIFFLDFYF